MSHRTLTTDDVAVLRRQIIELEHKLAMQESIQREMHESSERYRLLIETSPDAIALIGLDGIFLMCNQSKAELLGFDHPDELLGKHFHELIAPEYHALVQELVTRVIEAESIRNVRYEMIRPSDGVRIPVETSASVLRDSHKRPEGFLSISRNITDQVRYERERETIVTVAAAMRTATSRAEMVPILLNQMTHVLDADEVTLCRMVNGELILEHQVCKPDASPHIGSDTSLHTAFVPLIVQESIIGKLCIRCQRKISGDDMHLLRAIGDMAANAFHRMSLHEQTMRRLKHLQALHTIDMAITTSLDLNHTLDVLLEQVMVQLNVDAADVLLYNPITQMLEYAAARGFRFDTITRSRVALGEGYAGHAAHTQSLVCIPDVRQEESRVRNAILDTEGLRTYYGVPLIARGALKGVLEIFHQTPFKADQEWLDFFKTMASQAAIAIDNAEMFAELERSNDELILAYDATIQGWARALELRDVETEGHSRRVTDLTLMLAHLSGFKDEDIVHIRRGALLHDIGKMAIPDSILLKAGPLTDEEYAIMQQHTLYAYDMLSPIRFLRPALDIPLCHHEKWDGTGYPQGLKGTEIPFPARIFAVVDVYDALLSDRPYRNGWQKEAVCTYIREQAGKHFDPHIVEIFLQMVEVEKGYERDAER
jgi:PAS domain S-box-containing protein